MCGQRERRLTSRMSQKNQSNILNDICPKEYQMHLCVEYIIIHTTFKI